MKPDHLSDPPDTADPDVAAAAWFHRLAAARGEDAADTRRMFQQWLDASPDHADAFARTTAAWGEVGAHATEPEMMALREAAIADSRSAGLDRWRAAPRTGASRWPALIAATIMVAAVVAGAGAYVVLRSEPPSSYATEIGERRTVTLSDNSRMDIDADSAIATDFTSDRRLVRVLRGQAYFAVEKDPARPFIVEANGRRVIATGTEFDVEKFANGMTVTLVKGHVLVQSAADGGAAHSTELEPLDQFTDLDNSPPQLVHLASTLDATAWRQGKMLFNGESLQTALARMGRYSHETVVADSSVAQLKVSGAFDAGDMTAFLGAVEAYYPVKAVSEPSGTMRLMHR